MQKQRAKKWMAPRAGIEPATFRLTVERSTAELPRNKPFFTHRAYNKAPLLCKAVKVRSAFAEATERHPSYEGLAEPKLRSSEGWRPRPESNRGARICSPLRNHSATWPLKVVSGDSGRTPPLKAKPI